MLLVEQELAACGTYMMMYLFLCVFLNQKQSTREAVLFCGLGILQNLIRKWLLENFITSIVQGEVLAKIEIGLEIICVIWIFAYPLLFFAVKTKKIVRSIINTALYFMVFLIVNLVVTGIMDSGAVNMTQLTNQGVMADIVALLGEMILIESICGLKKHFVGEENVIALLPTLLYFFAFFEMLGLTQMEGFANVEGFHIFVSCVICVGSTIAFYFSFQLADYMQLRKEKQELEGMYELEQEKYRQLEQRHEEYAKIRHDFNNQLAVAYALIENQSKEDARNMLGEMQDRISTKSLN